MFSMKKYYYMYACMYVYFCVQINRFIYDLIRQLTIHNKNVVRKLEATKIILGKNKKLNQKQLTWINPQVKRKAYMNSVFLISKY